MLKKLTVTIVLICAGLAIIGCSSVPFLHTTPKEDESEIIISCGSTLYNGKYSIFLNGEARKFVKNKGGTIKYIVPNGQYVIMAAWQDNYGISSDMTSIRVNANSNRTFLYVTKTGSIEDMEVKLVEVINILP